MSCPYFCPVAPRARGAGPESAMLPLGDEWAGVCRAAPDPPPEPEEAILRSLCNFGYARGSCTRFPGDEGPDAVRFSVSRDDGASNNSGHVAFLAGDVVKNLYLSGKRKYKTINILAIVTGNDVDKYSFIMNNIISSNDGAFSMGLKYRVGKNRREGVFSHISHERYIIEPRLEGPEKLLFLLRPAAIELDITTQNRFSDVFGVEVR